MAENGGDKEDKFDAFTRDGETLGYISLEQARVLAMRHARDNSDFYGPAFADINLVWEVSSQEEGEDYYDIRLSFRPAGRFLGEPGLEQFIIDKTGTIEFRQVLDEPTGLRQPSGVRPRPLLVTAIGLVIVAVVGVATVLASGILDEKGEDSPAAVPPVPTRTPTPELRAPDPLPTAIVAAKPASTLMAANAGTVSLAQIKQMALQELQRLAPGLAQARVDEVINAMVAEAQTGGKTSFTQQEAKAFLAWGMEKIPEASTGPAPVVAVNSEKGNFKIQLACVGQGLPQCGLLKDFAARVGQRTGGRLEFVFTSYPELGLGGPEVLKLIADGKVPLAEVYGRWVAGELPVVDLPSIWGLFPDQETNLRVLDVIREELRRLVADRSNGVVILENYYPGSLFFSKKPLRSPEDFRGLKTRSNSAVSGDLLRGLGAEPRFLDFSEVYTALERGIIDAAVTATPQAALGQRWYEVSHFLIGPVPFVEFSWLTMNRGRWNALPQDVRAIIREEAARHQKESLRLATGDWLKQGIQDNIDRGMEYLFISPELKAAFRQAAISTLLPNWVKRVGGPNSAVVKFYNEHVAPIVGIKVNPNGSASEIQPRGTSTFQPPLGRRPILLGPEANVHVGVAGDALQFDTHRFTVRTGAPVRMTFKNASTVNQHNWVLVKPGAKDQVAAAGVKAGASFGWIPPDDDRVIAQIGLLHPGEAAEIQFSAPAVGRYQFVCTFPGHNVTMFGDFNVVR